MKKAYVIKQLDRGEEHLLPFVFESYDDAKKFIQRYQATDLRKMVYVLRHMDFVPAGEETP